MLRTRFTTTLTTSSLVVALGLVGVLSSPTMAAAPGNDDLGSATVVGGLPFHDTLDTSEATPQGIDPECSSGEGNPSVWYTFTPGQDSRMLSSTRDSDYDTTLVVGTRDGGGDIDVIRCNDDWDGGTSRVLWNANAGQEYLIMVGAFGGGSGGQLELGIETAPPPPSIRLTVASTARLTSLGAAIVRGTVRCQNTEGRPRVAVEARQDAGRRIIRGFGSERVECNGPWAVRVRNYDFRFVKAELLVRATALACNDAGCRSKTVRRTVRLR